MWALQPEGWLPEASRLRPINDAGVIVKHRHLVVRIAAGGPRVPPGLIVFPQNATAVGDGASPARLC